ncbi:MAG: O-antigen ligase family protein [Pirellulales bacterium]|nr:O-antigen ligase family protein [Pirellulales bacterium]
MVDAGLAGVVFLVPLVMGGRQAAGQAILTILAFFLGICWCLRQALARQAGWVHSRAELILLAAVVLTALQLVPLPPSALARVSPHVYEVLPLWSPQAAGWLGTWRTVSLDPEATRSCLTLIASCGLIFLVTVQRIRAVEDVERLLRVVAATTVLMASFGLAQFLAGNGMFFWYYEHPFSDTSGVVKGSFTNRNHFAQFIVLGIGSVVWWLFDARARRRESPAWPFSPSFETTGLWIVLALRLAAAAACVLAVLLSLSRGGFVALCAAAVVAIVMLYRADIVNGKTLFGAVALTTALVIAAAAYGYERVADRLDDFRSLESLDGAGGRSGLWAAAFRTIADYPMTGTGMGTHREVYRMYMDPPGIEYTHAENGYLQIAMEAGLPGLLLACCGVAVYCFWCVALAVRTRSRQTLLALGAIAPPIAASAVHSLFDFVWYVPGCMVPVVVLGACACRLWQMERQQTAARTGNVLSSADAGRRACKTADGTRSVPATAVPRFVWAGAACLLVLLASKTVPDRLAAIPAEQAWHRYLVQSRQTGGQEGSNREESCRGMLQTLSSVVRRQPNHSRAHARIAVLNLELFERLQSRADPPFGVTQIRDAAMASQFASSAALQEWLGRVAGPNLASLENAWTHARRSLASCPLQGSAYVVLAKLAFLEGPRSPGKAAYVAQAVQIRPLDGDVQFEAGVEALLAGEAEEALAHWEISFQAGPAEQKRLLQTFSRQLPPEVFLERFKADLSAIRLIATSYGGPDQAEELARVRAWYACAAQREAEASKGREAAALWQEAAGVHAAGGSQRESAWCLQRALESDPSYFEARLQLATTLSEAGDLAGAEKELQFCRRQRPYDQKVRGFLEQVVEKRLRVGRGGSDVLKQ